MCVPNQAVQASCARGHVPAAVGQSSAATMQQGLLWQAHTLQGCWRKHTCQVGEHAAPPHSLLQRALQGGRRRRPQLEPRRQQPHQLRLGVGLLLLVGATWARHSSRPCSTAAARLCRPLAAESACLQAAMLAGVGQQEAVPLLQLQGRPLQEPLIVLGI